MVDMHQDQRRVRVAVVPAGRPDLSRLVDPTAVAEVAPAGIVGPAWAAALADLVDVVHVHDGLGGGRPVQQAAALGTVLDQRDIPLVVTVHDLPRPGSHDEEELAGLLAWADVVIAPHGGAAGEVRRRWGARPRVVSAPSVLSAHDIRRCMAARVARSRPWVAVAGGACADVAAAADRLETIEPGLPVDVRAHDLPGPAVAVDWVAAHDLLVLPPWTATRGVWAELARDVGTGIVVPVGPTEVEPRALATYVRSAGPGSIARAVAAAVASLAAVDIDPDRRIAAGMAARDLHTQIYRDLAVTERGRQ